MRRKNEGITLVALIITIIVLIILAGVTISMVVGDDGIITKAKEASQNMSNATSEEKELLQNMLNTMNEIESGIGGGNEPEKTDNPNIKEYHNGVPIPKGFYYVGGEADTGLVISDHQDDENEAVEAGQTGDITVPLKGNQFVWIPVKVEETDTETDIKAFKRTTTYDGTITDPDTDYTDPYSGITSADETGEKAEYAEMYKSVYKYHGFYVGRYEAGCSTERTDSNKATAQGQSNPVLVQKDKYVYNYVPWGASMTSIAPASSVIGAVELSREMYPKESEEYGVTSGLMYGVQWDAVMMFVNDVKHPVKGDSSSWGNYYNYTGGGTYEKDKLQKTGVNENWKAKNMYDLAGNALEWTNEANDSNKRVNRGGVYNDDGNYSPASYRGSKDPDFTSNDLRTFRPMLCVKLNTV